MADDELDAMMADLEEFEVGGSNQQSSSSGLIKRDSAGKIVDGPLAPGVSFVPVARDGKIVKRHDAESLGRELDSMRGEALIGKVPDMPEQERTVVGVCGNCNKDVDTSSADYTFTKLGDGSVYHDKCFVCSSCRKDIEGGCAVEHGALKCANCVFVARCVRCKKDILASMSYMAPEETLTLHSECLSCGKCSKKLDKNSAFIVNHDLVCRSCAEQ